MIWGFADAWGICFAWSWLASLRCFASLRSGRSGALSCFALLCPVVTIWLRSSPFAIGFWLRLGLGFVAICFVWSWLRFGRAWLGLGFVAAWLRSGFAWLLIGYVLAGLRRAALSMPGALRSGLLCAGLCRCAKVFYGCLPALLFSLKKSFGKSACKSP